jgi:hypothetical protein
MRTRNIIIASLAAVIAALAIGAAGAQAAGLLTGKGIKDGSVHRVDLGAGVNKTLATATSSTDSLDGAVYRVENYVNGGGGSATVACDGDEAVSQTYTAIAGGVQGGTVGSQSADGFAVNSSFPGRMDWATGEPKADRLDGWIVLGNGKHTDTLKVWALCVPSNDIAVQTVDLAN